MKKRSSLRTVWFFVKPYKFSLLPLLALSILIGVFETLHVAVLYPILEGTLSTQSGQDSGFLITAIGNLARIIPVDDVVIASSILFIILSVLFFSCRMVYLVFSLRVASKIVTEAKQKVFQRYISSDYQFFVDNKQGELLYKLGATGALSTLLDQLTKFLIDAIFLVSLLFLLFSLLWQGAVLVIILGAGYLYFTRYLGSRVSYVTGIGRREAGERETVAATEYITGAKPIKVFDTSTHWRTQYYRAVDKSWTLWRKASFWNQTPSSIISLVLFSSVAIAVVVMRILNPVDFVLMIPVFGTFIFAVFRLLPKLSGFGSTQMHIMGSLPNIELVYELLHDTTYSKVKNGNEVLSRLNAYIEFSNVEFTHKKRKATLRNVSLKIEKGKVTAIAGPSGTGKSTIVDLLLRLYDVDEGGIYIDGKDIREYDVSSILARFGFVGQETFIFNASVGDNIDFGNGYALEEIIEAATLANADEFIQQLPEGYDTLVGDRGVKLSGGEKQRIAIARAMIRRPDLLILDEATSSLDSISENTVQQAIDIVSKNCTTLIVAHRLETIRNADIIYVLDKGQVVECGSHNQLMKQNGKYCELYGDPVRQVQ